MKRAPPRALLASRVAERARARVRGGAARGALALVLLGVFIPVASRAQDGGRVRAPVRPVQLAIPPLGVMAMSVEGASTNAQVRGHVLDAGGDRPLPEAMLRIEGNGTSLTTRSSIDGTFHFAAVAPGSYTLVVARVAYRPTRLGITVPPGGALVVDVQLTRLPVALQRVYVEAPRIDSTGARVGTLDIASLTEGQRAPSAVDLLASQGGALGALASEATARRAGEPGSDRDGRTLYIWGAKDAGARVTLDGIPLGAPLHLGGLLPVVDEALMAPPQLRTAGASPRYDGGTDYVLDLATRPPAADSLRAWASADLLTTSVGGEVPLGAGGSVLAGARRIDARSLARTAGIAPGYEYGDILARVQLAPAAGQALRITGFGTREGIGIPRDQGVDQAAWENRAAAAAWERNEGTTRSLLRGGVSHASIDLPLLTLTDGHLRADADRAVLLAERRWSARRHESTVGVEWERLQVQRSVAGDSLGVAMNSPTNVSTCPIDATCVPLGASAAVAGQSAALYVDHRRALTPRLQMGVGLRAAFTPGVPSTVRELFLPRIALEALPLDGTTLRLSVGRYSRLATVFDGSDDLAVGSQSNSILPGDARQWMTRATATQFEVGGTQRWREMTAGVAAYWSRPGLTPVGEEVAPMRGIDASARIEQGETVLQASLSHVVRDVSSEVGQTSSTLPDVRRVERRASIQGSTAVGRFNGKLSVSYARGLSFTSIVLERPAAATFDGIKSPVTSVVAGADRGLSPVQDAYLRVDASVSARWCVGGGACRLVVAPYARVLNALDRRDAIFYYSDPAAEASNRIAGIPALLTLGVRFDAARGVR